MSKKKPTHRPGGLKITQTWTDEAEQVIPSSITGGGILSILNSGASLIPPQIEADMAELRKLVEESIKAKGITKGKGSGPDDPEAFAEWLKKKPYGKKAPKHPSSPLERG